MVDIEVSVKLIATDKRHSVVQKIMDEQLADVPFFCVYNGDKLL
jgi:hypothetical protein